MDLNTLSNKIDALQKEVDSLKQSNSIPGDVIKSFIGNGFVKYSGPAIYVIGEDQGAWLNHDGYMAFPSAFAKITEGEFNGFWIPLYIPPRQIL